MLQALKNIVKPLYWFVSKNKLYRRLRTANYNSGRVLLGERNSYYINRNWVTVDVEGADFNVVFGETTELPFAGNSQSVIYSSHMIEHLDDPSLGMLFKECFRILRPGGYLRLEAPDAEGIINAYLTSDQEFIRYFSEDNKRNLILARGLPSVYGEAHIGILGLLSCYVDDDCHVPAIAGREEFDRQLRTLSLDDFGKWCVSLQTAEQRATHGHINVIYFDKLVRLLSQAGFKNIQRKGNSESGIPNLNLRGIEREHRAFYSVYVEASK